MRRRSPSRSAPCLSASYNCKMNRKLDELGGVYNKCVKRGRAFCHDWVLSGYGEMKITEMGYPQPLFTTKGSLRVAEIFTSEGVV